MMLSRDRHALLLESLTRRNPPVANSAHFTLYRLAPPTGADEWVIVHDFRPEQIDNNLGHYVAEELLPLLAERALTTNQHYAYSEQQIFERNVGDIVRSMEGDARRAWHRFYDNTLVALHEAAVDTAVDSGNPADFIRNFGAIYARAIRLMKALPSGPMQPFSVLDVATCFGFFPLLMAQQRTGMLENLAEVTGWDLNPALVDLANDVARQRRYAGIRFELADILADKLPGPSFDVVTAIHLLEHLEPEQTSTALANLWKLTKQRLIIAVPLEAIPDARFGHRQVFDRQRLQTLGRQLGGDSEYFEDHGGWLAIDRNRSCIAA
jgi:2-polyprenyl-3-methyl-5-hydroxy-6-metoxy-1,4-benzoquinol methylase